jgi:protein import protein ZIM17
MSLFSSRLHRLVARPTLPSLRQRVIHQGATSSFSNCHDHHCCKHVATPHQQQQWRQFSSNVPPVDDADMQLALDAVKEETATTEETPLPGAQKGGKKLAIVFTCKVCNTRSAKQFTEQAYNHGVVLVTCPGCGNQHLIADRLGFFQDESWDVEKAMKENGEKFTAVTNDNVLELTLKDVLGDRLEEAMHATGQEAVVEVENDDETTTIDKKHTR